MCVIDPTERLNERAYNSKTKTSSTIEVVPDPVSEPLVLNTLIGIGVGDSPIVDLVTELNNKQCQLQCENWLSSRNNHVCIYNKEVRECALKELSNPDGFWNENPNATLYTKAENLNLGFPFKPPNIWEGDVVGQLTRAGESESTISNRQPSEALNCYPCFSEQTPFSYTPPSLSDLK